MSPAAYIAFSLIAVAAWAYHGVREHHAHLRLLRVVRPSTAVPPTSHDSGWHALGHWKRMAVNTAMLGGAIVIGLCWDLSWVGTFFALVAFGTAWAVIAMVRAMGGAVRRREQRPETITERKAA